MIRSKIEVDTEAVKKALEEATDWSGQCRICKREIKGTLEEMRNHRCELGE